MSNFDAQLNAWWLISNISGLRVCPIWTLIISTRCYNASTQHIDYAHNKMHPEQSAITNINISAGNNTTNIYIYIYLYICDHLCPEITISWLCIVCTIFSKWNVFMHRLHSQLLQCYRVNDNVRYSNHSCVTMRKFPNVFIVLYANASPKKYYVINILLWERAYLH